MLRKRVQHDGIDLDDDEALDAHRRPRPDNVRALEGALIRVVAFHSLTGRPLTPRWPPRSSTASTRPPTGRRAAPPPSRRSSSSRRAFGLTLEELSRTSRAARLAWPRQVAMYLAREHTTRRSPRSAGAFGGRNHTTVMHACQRTGERIARDPEAFEAVRRLTDRLHTPGDDRSPDRLRTLVPPRCALSPQPAGASGAAHTSTAPMTPIHSIEVTT